MSIYNSCFFFSETEAYDLLIHYLRSLEGITNVTVTQNTHSPNINLPKCLAPKIDQRAASSLMLARRIRSGAYLFRKTHALRSLQMTQQENMMREAMAFLLEL